MTMRVACVAALALVAATAWGFVPARRLAWDPNPAAELVTAYRVLRDGVQVAEVLGDVTEWVIADLITDAPVTQCYRVVAVSAWGVSDPSAEVCTGGGPSQAGSLRIEPIP